MTNAADSPGEPLLTWLRRQPHCHLEDGLSEDELDQAEQHFQIRFPPLWRAILSQAHPIALPKPPRGHDGVLRWTDYPDWRLRDEAATRDLIDAPVNGLLFDVERSDFWWTAWGTRPDDIPARLSRACDRLTAVPGLVPLWGHLYLASSDDSPVFSIVQADLYIPALTIRDLPGGRNQDAVPVGHWPIGAVAFWSELHAYSQLGHQGPFAHLGTGGL